MFEIIDITELYRENYTMHTINKTCDVLSCRISGESQFFYNNEKHSVKTGDVIYIPAGSTYYQETDGEQIIYFHILSDNKLYDKIEFITCKNPKEFSELFKQVHKVWKSGEKNKLYKCMALIYEIISKLPFATCAKENKMSCDLKEAIKYIDAHVFDTEFTVEKAIEKSFLCKSYFYKIFKDYFNCTPIQYVNHKRIQRAKQLLNTGNYTKEEIAYLCGVDNIKYFYKLFKNITGHTMGDYIKLSNIK